MRPGGGIAVEIHALDQLARLAQHGFDGTLQFGPREDFRRSGAEIPKRARVHALRIQDRIQHEAAIGMDVPLGLGGCLPVDEPGRMENLAVERAVHRIDRIGRIAWRMTT